jgi:hypothetical protein
MGIVNIASMSIVSLASVAISSLASMGMGMGMLASLLGAGAWAC